MLYIHTDIRPVIIYNQNNNKQTVTYTKTRQQVAGTGKARDEFSCPISFIEPFPYLLYIKNL